MPDTKVALEENQAGLNSAKLKTIADKADIIVNGYAFTRNDERIQVLNLNCPEKAVVFSTDGEVLETTMDDIELSIASRYLQQNKKYMEEWTMPKYYDFKVAGYYLYFTSFCVVECMHVHASDSKLTEGGSAKFFVKSTGDAALLQIVPVLFFLADDTHSALLFPSQIVLMVFDWYVKKVTIVQPCQRE